MAAPQTSIPVTAPGSLGLNTKAESLDLGPFWSTEIKNAVVAADGTLGARKGWQKTFDTAIESGADIKSIHEYIDSGGVSRIIYALNNKIYESEVTPSEVTGTITTPTADNWKFVTFNNKCIGVQAGHAPIVKSDSGNFADISFDTAPSDPYEVLAAWGRVWYVDADKQTIKYSDLLQEDTMTTGSSGVLNMQTVWSTGSDEIVALAEFNNLLVVFGRKQVVIFSGGEDPNNELALVDIITNTGCIARDSVQNLSADVLFLSEHGVISIARSLETGSLPISNVSENVANFLSLIIRSEPEDNIKSVFNIEDGYYLISFPTANRTFYFTFRYLTDEGQETQDLSLKARVSKPRVSVWTDITPTAFGYTRSGDVLLGKEGLVGRYTGYQDNGESYDFEFKTGWFSGQGQESTIKKIFKQAVNTIKSGFSVPVVFEWDYDYQPTAYGSGINEVEAATSPSEFGIAEYGISEYTASNYVSSLIYNMSGSGKTFRMGFRAVIDGANLEIQKTELFIKTGKINRRGR